MPPPARPEAQPANCDTQPARPEPQPARLEAQPARPGLTHSQPCQARLELQPTMPEIQKATPESHSTEWKNRQTDVRLFVQINGQKISSFYRTTSPLGATALLPPKKTKKELG